MAEFWFWILLIVSVVIITIEYFRTRFLEKEIDKLTEELAQTHDLYKNLTVFLGYYRLRFGEVSWEDVQNLKGVSKKKLDQMEKDLSNDASQEYD